ncbi:MAG: hypothetical protein EPN93_17970 [Spirochaetes bacterium]|nr:MAG: hypothetical protein EPN93_17970 [Spirochaetota bacterium]
MKLSSREKYLLYALGGMLAFTLAYYLIIMPLVEYRSSTQQETRKNVSDITRLEALYDQYRDIKQRKTRYQTQLGNRNENISTLIEQWANTADVSKNIAYNRRTQANIQNKYTKFTSDIKLDAVPVQKFFRFLYEIENSNSLLKVSYLKIYQGMKGADTYDVIIKIDSFTQQ